MSKTSLESGYGSNSDDFIPEPNVQRIRQDQMRLQNNFEIGKVLMNSANGRIYTGRVVKTQEQVILKQIPRVTCHSWTKFQGHLVPSEIAYHFHAAANDSDDVIIRPITWLEKRSSFVLVMEYAENTIDLFDLSQKYGPVNQEAACIIFRQIVAMLKTLDRSGICHRDIKDENIVINLNTLQVKLIDFGCATKTRHGVVTDFSGTPEFYPPEFWSEKTYTQNGLSMWSCGIVLYILLNGRLPYDNVSELQFYRVEHDLSVEKLPEHPRNILYKMLQRSNNTRLALPELERLVSSWESSL